MSSNPQAWVYLIGYDERGVGDDLQPAGAGVPRCRRRTGRSRTPSARTRGCTSGSGVTLNATLASNPHRGCTLRAAARSGVPHSFNTPIPPRITKRQSHPEHPAQQASNPHARVYLAWTVRCSGLWMLQPARAGVPRRPACGASPTSSPTRTRGCTSESVPLWPLVLVSNPHARVYLVVRGLWASQAELQPARAGVPRSSRKSYVSAQTPTRTRGCTSPPQLPQVRGRRSNPHARVYLVPPGCACPGLLLQPARAGVPRHRGTRRGRRAAPTRTGGCTLRAAARSRVPHSFNTPIPPRITKRQSHPEHPAQQASNPHARVYLVPRGRREQERQLQPARAGVPRICGTSSRRLYAPTRTRGCTSAELRDAASLLLSNPHARVYLVLPLHPAAHRPLQPARAGVPRPWWASSPNPATPTRTRGCTSVHV